MLRRFSTRRLVLAFLIIAALGLVAWLVWSRMFSGPRVQTIELDDGTPATLVTPPRNTLARVLVITPHDTRLSPDELAGFARHGGARVIQLELPEGRDCDTANRLVDHAIDALKGTPDLVAGIEEGGGLDVVAVASAQDLDVLREQRRRPHLDR